MNGSALLTMLITLITVTSVTLYFLIKVYTMPPKPEPDSYTENDKTS
jgi:hypothetical protein